MDLLVLPDGTVRAIYAEEIDLGLLGSPSITRASHVEPDEQGRWRADLSAVTGPVRHFSLIPTESAPSRNSFHRLFFRR